MPIVLADGAEVWDDAVGNSYRRIRVQSNSDDEAIFSAKLTPVAARGGRLISYRYVIEKADSLPKSIRSEHEKIWLVISRAEVLQLFIALDPTEEPAAERFARAVGTISRGTAARAWEILRFLQRRFGRCEHLA